MNYSKNKIILTPFRLAVLFVTLSLFSIFSLDKLVFRLNSDHISESLEISFSCLKTTPEQTELSITSKIENSLSRVENINSITSFSGEDNGSINISFNSNSDLKKKRFELLLAIRQIFEKLPNGTSFPIISDVKDSEYRQPILSYSLSGVDKGDVGKIKHLFEKHFRSENILCDLEVTGLNKKYVKIEYDKFEMYSKNVSITDMYEAIESLEQQSYIGTASFNAMPYFVKIKEEDGGLDALLNTEVVTDPVIRIKDFAEVFETYEDETLAYRINGKNTVLLHLYDTGSRNLLQSYYAIKNAVNIIENELRKGQELRVEQDTTKYLRQLIRTSVCNTFLSLLLVILLFFFIYGWRHLFIIISSLLINVCLLIITMSVLKIPIDLYMINSFAFCLGFLGLNLLITLRSSVSPALRKRNYLVQSVCICVTAVSYIWLFSSGNMSLTPLNSLLKLMLVVLVISMLINTLFTSSFFDLIDVPTTKSTQIKGGKLYKKFISKSLKQGWGKCAVLLAGLLITGMPIFLLPDNIENFSFYNRTIGSAFSKDHILPFASDIAGGFWRNFHENIYQHIEQNDLSETILTVTAEMPIGSTFEHVDDALKYLEQFISTSPFVDTYVSQVLSAQRGTLKVKFIEETPSYYPSQLRVSLINASQNLGGIGWTFFGVGRGFSSKELQEYPSFQVKLSGYNYNILRETSAQVKSYIEKNERVNEVMLSSDEGNILKGNQEYRMQVKDRSIMYHNLDQKDIKVELIISNSVIANRNLHINLRNEVTDVKISPKNISDLTMSDFLKEPLRVDENYIKPMYFMYIRGQDFPK